MKAKELIGKVAIRTAPVKFNGDRSYTNKPVFIVNATDSHVSIEYVDEFDRSLFGSKVFILGCDFADNNWTSYDELLLGMQKLPKTDLSEYSIQEISAELLRRYGDIS